MPHSFTVGSAGGTAASGPSEIYVAAYGTSDAKENDFDDLTTNMTLTRATIGTVFESIIISHRY